LRWGLSPEAVQLLGRTLQNFCNRFAWCFQTTTRDSSAYALSYLSAQLRLEQERNFTNIAQVSAMSAQNIHHFMSNSPWNARSVIWQALLEISHTPGLERGGALVLDESASEKAGADTIGSARQYNGRLGKVEMSQVGVFLAFAHLQHNVWTWLDGELFLPEAWFQPDRQEQRLRLGLPEERTFATKLELGAKMIQRVKQNGLNFEIVACDALYGQADWLRAEWEKTQICYMADVPSNQHVAPVLPERAADLIWTVSDIAQAKTTHWQSVTVRATERGHLCDSFACVRVWTWRDGQASPEWLVMRREANGEISSSLCNAPEDTSLQQLAAWKCVRYFVERANQDAKSEIGWEDLRAQKYRAWEHHLALTIMASWFVAQTKYSWALQFPPEQALAQQLQIDRLAPLSIANVRTLLRAVLPLPQLTPEEATRQVVRHLFNRTQSRKSRLKNGKSPPT
jgi:SRSO17 transposase